MAYLTRYCAPEFFHAYNTYSDAFEFRTHIMAACTPKKISLHIVYVARYTIYFDAKLFWRSTPTRPIDIVMFRDLLMQLHLSKNLNEIWNLLFCRQHLSSGSETYQNASWFIFAVKKKYHRLVIFYTIMVQKAACH